MILSDILFIRLNPLKGYKVFTFKALNNPKLFAKISPYLLATCMLNDVCDADY